MAGAAGSQLCRLRGWTSVVLAGLITADSRDAAAAAAGSIDVKSSGARSECREMITRWKRTVISRASNHQRAIHNQIRQAIIDD